MKKYQIIAIVSVLVAALFGCQPDKHGAVCFPRDVSPTSLPMGCLINDFYPSCRDFASYKTTEHS